MPTVQPTTDFLRARAARAALLAVLCAACTPEGGPAADTMPRIRSPGSDPAALRPLTLPDTLPFAARSRISPTTLVDERGQVLLVLEAVGVELEVQQVLGERALVRCTGCRAPVDAWVQRAALFVGTTAAGGPHDDWLAWLNAQGEAPWADPARHGFALVGPARVAPPWYAEGGYAGSTLTLTPTPDGWSAAQTPAGEAPPGGPSKSGEPP